MSIEQTLFPRESNKEKTEQEIKEEIKKRLEFEKSRKTLLLKIEKNKQLAYLKSIIERWLIWLNTVEHIINWDQISVDEAREIFDKIDQIEDIKDINIILPEYYRISREEYMKWIEDDDYRQILLSKIDEALKYIYVSTHSTQSPILSLFYNLMSNFNRNNKTLVLVQGNLIDIKRSLL